MLTENSASEHLVFWGRVFHLVQHRLVAFHRSLLCIFIILDITVITSTAVLLTTTCFDDRPAVTITYVTIWTGLPHLRVAKKTRKAVTARSHPQCMCGAECLGHQLHILFVGG